MLKHSFEELKSLIYNRLELIEVDRYKYSISVDYKNEDMPGNLHVFFEDQMIVTFHYVASNFRDYGEQKAEYCPVEKSRKYPEWYQKRLENRTDIVCVNEFYFAYVRGNCHNDLQYYLDFYLPLGKKECKQKIIEIFKNASIDNIVYDTYKKAYLISIDFTNFFSETDEKIEEKYVYKYVSLDTYRNILNHKLFRMNSILSMNDIYEGIRMDHLLYGLDIIEKTELMEKYIENKNILITSFTDKSDDASMWKLYGYKGNGVCLGFKVLDKGISKVIYVSENNSKLKELQQKVIILKNKGIQVRFRYSDKARYYNTPQF